MKLLIKLLLKLLFKKLLIKLLIKLLMKKLLVKLPIKKLLIKLLIKLLTYKDPHLLTQLLEVCAALKEASCCDLLTNQLAPENAPSSPW